MGVTLPTFHFVGKVCFSIQKLISLHRESAIAGAAILSNLALTPSLPVALYTGIERRRLTTLSLDICGILNVPETWDRGGGGGGLAPVDESLGAIHSTKISRPRFENFVGTNGSRRRPVSFQSSLNVSQNGGCSDAFARVNGRRCQRYK